MTAQLIYLFTFAHHMAITSAADLLDPISQSNHRETPCCCFYPDRVMFLSLYQKKKKKKRAIKLKSLLWDFMPLYTFAILQIEAFWI